MKEEIAKLQYWLAIRGNSKAKLAAVLGYGSSVTVQHWIDNGRIPENRYKQVMEILDHGITESGYKGKSQKTPSGSNLRP